MDFNLTQAITVLRRTPKVVRTLLKDIPSEWILSNEGGTTWSPFDVLGHLIHGERTDWMPRVRMILAKGESHAFDSFDRYAQFEVSKGKTLDELFDTFEELRGESIAVLEELGLGLEDLSKTGLHPQLGTVTLAELLATWVVHDLDHIVQIARTMAGQYRTAVGPWREFLSVLK
ncbi:MAG: DinB family protein [Acidobacteriota bacterium]